VVAELTLEEVGISASSPLLSQCLALAIGQVGCHPDVLGGRHVASPLSVLKHQQLVVPAMKSSDEGAWLLALQWSKAVSSLDVVSGPGFFWEKAVHQLDNFSSALGGVFVSFFVYIEESDVVAT
jgi:hypothetical protein